MREAVGIIQRHCGGSFLEKLRQILNGAGDIQKD